MAQKNQPLPIGEVLDTLRDDFPDLTVSKIRFLESQGLIAPERTASGYRMFAREDVELLRWILEQQEHNYLPLKIIKTQIEEGKAKPAAKKAKSSKAKKSSRSRKSKKKDDEMQQLLFDEHPEASDLEAAETGVSMTLDELAGAAGLAKKAVQELESYGLIVPKQQIGNDLLYDEEALIIARSAKKFGDYGFDARHLKMYKNFAQRELDLFAQVTLPLLKQRQPEARTEAQQQLADLARLGRALRAAFLRSGADEVLRDDS